jgi:uncharacterized Zn finger protein
MRYDDFYEPTSPRRTKAGIKAQSQRGAFAKQWWAKRWIQALEELLDAGRLRRGRSYARSGQVLSIAEQKGGIEAKVQGSRATPYRVRIELEPLSDRQWQAVIDALAERALFSAQLLAGEMPQAIEEAFAAAGVSLFPGSEDELRTDCSCPDWANPCKHVAAVHYILGEQFDEDPFLLFRLRGRTGEQLIEALRRQRSAAANTQVHEEVAPYTTNEQALPLTEEVSHFWSMTPPLAHLAVNIQPPVTPLTALKRLGQPPFLPESLETLLAPVYRTVSEAAIQAYEETTQTTPEDEEQA